MQPASHIMPIEIKVVVNDGKMCAFRAAGGRNGAIKSQSWVEWMVLPSGRTTGMGLTVGRMLVTDALMVQK